MATVEQVRQCDRQLQLGQNQEKKTRLVLEQVQANTGESKMFRSMGRMFVLCSGEELARDLNADLSRISTEAAKSTEMKTVLERKREELAKQLQDLAPQQ